MRSAKKATLVSNTLKLEVAFTRYKATNLQLCKYTAAT